MNTSKVFKNNTLVAEAFAKYLSEQIAESIGNFNIALSGGSTPKLLFKHLAKEYVHEIDWKRVHLYWGDERCVLPSDEESNYRMTYETLIEHINIPESNIHRVKGENLPKEEAINYGNLIETNLDCDNNLPVFDLIILGMGNDGHTASIFPHQIELLSVDSTCAVAIHPESGQLRITLTGKVINAAKQIHFLVTGGSKNEVLKEIFGETEGFGKYPASHINDATWWMDEAAIDEKFLNKLQKNVHKI